LFCSARGATLAGETEAQPVQRFGRREILGAALAGAAMGAGGNAAMPLVPFGKARVSRLIVGGNPISGNSHVSAQMDAEMRDYFTAARIKKLLEECQRCGINTWQSRADRHIMRVLNEYRLEGNSIQWIAQTAPEYGELRRNLSEIAAHRPIGIYHHGAQTDRYWNEGRIEEVREALKAIRQTGAQVGLGTHIPDVVDYAESKGWDLDFYMTCVYNLGRTREEASRMAGRPVSGEYFRDDDRQAMLARVKRTSKTCLIFKVYGATRQCRTPEARKAAVDLVFDFAKPGDAVVVGMFPKESEQVAENCRLVAESAARRSV
jgi:hypothetical protein